MSYTNGLDKPSDYFNTKLYTGNNADGHAITGVGFQPDFLWIKSRNVGYSHRLYDSIRGVNSALISDQTASENQYVDYGQLESFDSDGFTLGIGNTGGAGTNDGNNYVAWNWLADNTSGSSNTQGSITSTVSANTTSGFSIVSWSGTGANATIGHGLGTPPAMIIVKERNGTSSWITWHQKLSSYKHFLLLNTTGTQTDSFDNFQNVAPTNNVFSIGTEVGTNRSTGTYIAYCFAEKKGFSKAFSYSGNGSSNGSYIHLGFLPAWVLVKRTDSANAWHLFDNKRNTFNPNDKGLFPNTSDAENTGNQIDFLSNGIKFYSADGGYNGAGGSYIGLAFASNPFVTSTGIPTTAR